MLAIEADFQMWATFAVIVVAFALYALERTPLELTSLGVICVLLILFHVFPLPDEAGVNRLGAVRLLHGFASPALLTVLALLVIGEGLVRTGALDQAARDLMRLSRGVPWLSIALALTVVAVVSGFLNNIPVVVIFIPIMQALSERLGRSPRGLMMPLSFAAILGGMTTLIGSSTNLLVSNALVEVGESAFGFFDFTVPGAVMALTGLAYVILVSPRLLPARDSENGTPSEGGGRQFIAQITVSADSKLVGVQAVGGLFPDLPSMTVGMIQRGAHTLLPPFEDITVQTGDVVVVAATRKALTEALTQEPGMLHLDDGQATGTAEQTLAEAMITPTSRLIGQTLAQAHFRDTHHCRVLGIRRRSRMLRAQVTQIYLEAGDVLLVLGQPDGVRALRADPDILLMEWSATELPVLHYSRRAALIFLAVVAAAASGLAPVVIAAISGAALMVASGVLNMRQAAHTLDRNIVMMIATALALGAALQETGGAMFLAESMIDALGDAAPAVVLSAFFLLVAVLSNVLSTKTCAVLFTPIAVSIARGLGVDPMAFAVAVVFAANCSFASPIGYQTNLLVMTPGGYRFVDFVRVGSPLIVLMWITFSLFAPWYFGLW
ncbi:MAG: SLC13 family permease [Proteobacteria bacterium]|nr:SLC13 family permease [Pseudomonadota bacterium]